MKFRTSFIQLLWKLYNNYIEENKDRFLEELFGLLRIPSISSIKSHKPDMYKAAEYWKETFAGIRGRQS
jgi:acetylornithine deacetylase/succinyl-diaminopimelate desuccinylase-like protein